MGKSKSSTIIKLQRKKLFSFDWEGAKFKHLDWLLPLLPECHHYCEPFAGSGAVLLNRKPSKIETYNDLDGELVNFFQVLRSKEGGKLIEAIYQSGFESTDNDTEYEKLTDFFCLLPRPYTEFIRNSHPGLSAFERAKRFFLWAGWTGSFVRLPCIRDFWIYCTNTSKKGMSSYTSRQWLSGLKALPKIAERLLKVQLKNRPAVEIIKLYDSPQTLFFCDPPPPPINETREDINIHSNRMTDQDHEQLAYILNSVQGRVAVSNYDCDFMNLLYPAKKWFKITEPKKIIYTEEDMRVKSLWTNYKPKKMKARAAPKNEDIRKKLIINQDTLNRISSECYAYDVDVHIMVNRRKEGANMPKALEALGLLMEANAEINKFGSSLLDYTFFREIFFLLKNNGFCDFSLSLDGVALEEIAGMDELKILKAIDLFKEAGFRFYKLENALTLKKPVYRFTAFSIIFLKLS